MKFWLFALAVLATATAAPTTSAAPGVPSPAPAASMAQEDADLDCEDFETQDDAQAALDEDPADPNNLDPNGDGIACALLPAASDLNPSPRDAADAEAEQDVGDDGQTREERRAARQAERGTGQEGAQGDEAVVSCADFATAEDAQAAFDADPEGLASLDGDGNGLACEELLAVEPADQELTREERRAQRQGDEEPADVEIVIEDPAQPLVREDIDCIDFTYQEEAQQVFDQDPSDPYNLDPNGDAYACSSLPLLDPVVSQVPRTGTGVGAQLGAGALLATGLFVATGAAGLFLRREGRRPRSVG